MVIAKAVNANGTDPLTLYAGIEEATSPSGSRSRAPAPGQVRAADVNPYTLYSKLVGLTTTTPHGGTTTPIPSPPSSSPRARASTIWCAAELNSLMGKSALSSADKQRLQQHFDAIRDVEVTMGTMGADLHEDRAVARRRSTR